MAKTPSRKKKSSVTSDMNKEQVDGQPKASLILSEELVSQDGRSKIGVMTLNSAKTMNAVDLEMVNLIDDVIARWQGDDDVVAMVMRGAGDKAFCAGGDIRQLYDSMKATGEDHLQYADSFFTGEYGKNYRVHRFGKPLIAWGNGFVMGGGLGLYIGANHKVGTQTLKLAWPEIRIGLFPDVAGSYYLSRLEFPVGHWMALTGSQMNAADCKHAGLINYCLDNNDFNVMIEQLLSQPWQTNKAMNNQYVRELLTAMEDDTKIEFPESNLLENKDQINEIFSVIQKPEEDELAYIDVVSSNKKSLGKIAVSMGKTQKDSANSSWLNQGIDNFMSGCPATAHLIMQQLQKGKNMTLKEVVQWELVMALQSVRHPDFSEGIRAMVVDKDFQPKWQHDDVSGVPNEWVEEMMKPLWEGNNHPFKDL